MTDEDHQEMLAASHTFIRYYNYIKGRLPENLHGEKLASLIMKEYVEGVPADKVIEKIKEKE